MTYLTETPGFGAGVYQLETTDPVQGGPGGVANAQAQELANRTAYLLALVNALSAANAGLAPINSPSLTGTPLAPTPALGSNDHEIATTQWVQALQNGILSKSVAGSVNVALSQIEMGNGILVFTGALTANIAVILPAASCIKLIVNATSGAFGLTVKTAGGTGVTVAQGKSRLVYGDATNVNACDTDLSGAFSGAFGATAPAGDISELLATTRFVKNLVSGVATVNIGGNTDVVLTAAQYGCGTLILTGALTGNINVLVPAAAAKWTVWNQATGAYTVNLKALGGGGAVVPIGAPLDAICDGVNVSLLGAAMNSASLVGTTTIDKLVATNQIGIKANIVATGPTTTLALATADTFKVTLNVSSTIAFDISNVPAGNNVFSFNVLVVNGAAGLGLAFQAGVQWAGGIGMPPRATAAGAKDLWTFFTEDGGASYVGSLSITSYA